MSQNDMPIASSDRTLVSPGNGSSLASGFTVLSLAVIWIALCSWLGVPLFPFGAIAIAGCLFAAVQMVRTHRSVFGTSALVLALFVMTPGLVLPTSF